MVEDFSLETIATELNYEAVMNNLVIMNSVYKVVISFFISPSYLSSHHTCSSTCSFINLLFWISFYVSIYLSIYPIISQGLTHIGCYKLPIDGELEFFENSEELLADNPLNRTDPIRKCGQVALENKYEYFAVALGLCYSGSNALADYTSGGHSQICINGTGNYFGSFSVDVYHILDSEKFKTSSAGIDSCGSDYCMNNITCEDIYSSSMSMFASYRFYMALLIIITIYIV